MRFENVLDYLRWYTGDIYCRDSCGRITINKTEFDENDYRTINALLFPGVEIEKDKLLDKYPVMPKIVNMEACIELYECIIGMSQFYNFDSGSILKRSERKVSLDLCERLGEFPSFCSCTYGDIAPFFETKHGHELVQIQFDRILAVDVAKILQDEYKNKNEKELLIMPFHKVSVWRDPFKTYAYFSIRNDYSVEMYDFAKLRDRIVSEDTMQVINFVLDALSNNIDISESVLNQYKSIKNDIQTYVRMLVNKKIEDLENSSSCK